jgi:alanine racemase
LTARQNEYNSIQMLSYLEISKVSILTNIESFKKLIPKNTKLCAVIKGNAYGHGQNEVAKIIEKSINYFQVDDIEELRLLRKVSSKETFVFGYVPKEDLEELVLLDGILGVYDVERAAVLNSLAKKYSKKIRIHIKIDALLGRQGILLKDIPGFSKNLKKFKYLIIDGIYSHFSNIEDTDDLSHALKQMEYFDKARKIFEENGIHIPNRHFCATSGILVGNLLNKTFEIARLGIGMYGLWPSENLKRRYQKDVCLRPALTWITHVAQVKNVGKGFPIGYGITYITHKPTTVAVIPQGYSDGYDRGLSNCGQVMIKGTLCPVIGRVAMNMFAVDAGGLKLKQGDKAALIGSKNTADDIANKLGTINYEVVSRISPLLPRIVR